MLGRRKVHVCGGLNAVKPAVITSFGKGRVAVIMHLNVNLATEFCCWKAHLRFPPSILGTDMKSSDVITSLIGSLWLWFDLHYCGHLWVLYLAPVCMYPLSPHAYAGSHHCLLSAGCYEHIMDGCISEWCRTRAGLPCFRVRVHH